MGDRLTSSLAQHLSLILYLVHEINITEIIFILNKKHYFCKKIKINFLFSKKVVSLYVFKS
jgi:hypothetical protein